MVKQFASQPNTIINTEHPGDVFEALWFRLDEKNQDKIRKKYMKEVNKMKESLEKYGTKKAERKEFIEFYEEIEKEPAAFLQFADASIVEWYEDTYKSIIAQASSKKTFRTFENIFERNSKNLKRKCVTKLKM